MGTDFFRFTGTGTGNRARINFRGGRVLSAAAAGHIFTFLAQATPELYIGLGFADWTSEMIQRNPTKCIIKGSPWAWTNPPPSSGMFTNRFGGPLWEHGSVSQPPSEPMVDISTTTNAFNANEFCMQRVSVHHSTKPAFSFINNTDSDGAFYSCNRITIGTVEEVRRGFVKAYGALGLTVECGFYDSLTIDGHVVELVQASAVAIASSVESARSTL